MAIRQVIAFNDEKFRKMSKPVTTFDKRLHDLLDDMLDTLRDVNGYGCAAVHVGILKRVVVVDDKDHKGVIELINPVIKEVSQDIQKVLEGSIATGAPWGYVDRPVWVTVSAVDRHGQAMVIKGQGFLAATLLHEIEHLDAVLFTDKATEVITDSEQIRNKLGKR